jgi:hypothetical protein
MKVHANPTESLPEGSSRPGGGGGGLHFSYVRYIENRLRAEFEFFASPLRIKERKKKKKADKR